MRGRGVLESVVRNWRGILAGRWNRGHCPTCDRHTIFVEEGGSLRDGYRCIRCRSIPRWRALMLTIDNRFPNWRSLRIHEIAPGGAASDRLARECPGYTSSFYNVPGQPHEDVEALTFADGSIDLVISQDVIEHVLDPARAFAEIARVLRWDGAHVFTVPVYDRDRTLVRAMRDPDGEIVYLATLDFHDAPEGKSLVTREWGRDIVELIAAASSLETDIERTVDRGRGLDGRFLEVLVSVKR